MCELFSFVCFLFEIHTFFDDAIDFRIEFAFCFLVCMNLISKYIKRNLLKVIYTVNLRFLIGLLGWTRFQLCFCVCVWQTG